MEISPGGRLSAWEVAPADTACWEQVLATDPYAVASQAPAWVDAVCATGPYRPASLQLRSPDGRRLVLPMVRRRGLPAAAAGRLSMPGRWGHGGLVAEHGVLRPADVTAAISLVARAGAGPLVVVPAPRLDDRWRGAADWSCTTPKVDYELDTSGGFEEVWTRRFSSGVRRAVRKAERSGVVVERDSTGRLLPQFLALYQESAQRWAAADGMPAWLAARRSARLEPLAKLQRVAAGFGEACVTWMAFVGGRPAAAVIVLSQGANVDYWRGAMTLQLAGPVRANDLLHRRHRGGVPPGRGPVLLRHQRPGDRSRAVQGGLRRCPGAPLRLRPGAVPRPSCHAHRSSPRAAGGRGGDVRSSAHGRSVSVTAPGGSPCRAAPVRSTGGSSPRGRAGGCRSGR